MSAARYVPASYEDRVVKRVVEETRREKITEPVILLELSLTEARLVQVLLGNTQAGGPTSPIYSRLGSALDAAFGPEYNSYLDSYYAIVSPRSIIRLDPDKLPPLEPRE